MAVVGLSVVGVAVEGVAVEGIATTVGVDFLTKPAEEGLVIAIFHRSGEGRNIPIRSLPKLGRGQIAESICGKVTKAAKGPVDVLEATACIVGNF
jgi:hypothetical protein